MNSSIAGLRIIIIETKTNTERRDTQQSFTCLTPPNSQKQGGETPQLEPTEIKRNLVRASVRVPPRGLRDSYCQLDFI